MTYRITYDDVSEKHRLIEPELPFEIDSPETTAKGVEVVESATGGERVNIIIA